MSSASRSCFEQSLADYFRERLQELAASLTPAPCEDTLWYMGDMLARYGASDQLFSYDQGEYQIRPLALLYKDANETSDPRERYLITRQLGDMALFMGALFPERYARKGILKDYFVGMGGGAYSYLSETAPQNRAIFSELAAMFTRALELVARACAKETAFDHSDVLILYQRWQSTGDPLLADQLQALGITVNPSDMTH